MPGLVTSRNLPAAAAADRKSINHPYYCYYSIIMV